MKFKLNSVAASAKRAERNTAIRGTSLGKQAAKVEERQAQSYSADAAGIKLAADNSRTMVTLDESQRAALWMAVTNRRSCITGAAGTGKTTIMSHGLPLFRQQVREIDWSTAVTAGSAPGGPKRPAIALCCFTNVAAQNLASKLDEEWSAHCMSIHSMLAFAPIKGEEQAEEYGIDLGKSKGMYHPRYHAGNKMPYEFIIIDEAGIVSNDLWQQVLDACSPTTRILLLGDLFQLPALYGVSPMPFAMGQWPTAHLTKIYRQADGSPIITQAHRVRKGLPPEHVKGHFLCGASQTVPESAIKARQYIQRYLDHCHSVGVFDPLQDVIITPQNKTMLGQSEWNSVFRFQFNPERRDPKTGIPLNPPIWIATGLGTVDFCVGDKVMSTDNGGRLATESRFNNGSIGTIVEITPNPDYKGDMTGLGEQIVSLPSDMSASASAMAMFEATQEHASQFDDFDLADVAYKAETNDEDKRRQSASHIVTVLEQSTGETLILNRSAEIANLQHAYAVTCHKFQGSQARNVFIILHSSFNANMYSREWLYTAITRAKKGVILLHDKPALMRALGRQVLPGKDAADKADKIVAKMEASGQHWKIPKIPGNEQLGVSVELVREMAAQGITSDCKLGQAGEIA